ncbi:MAG: citrate/2-methylcitrate synthase, partial [Nitrososphaeraceae archaeon]|nr:citrate/2-methylcitrate synthase [Nitrososphaeraceae archaeon]
MDARNIGLRNIEVADTKICSIDGEHGKLIYRGYDILDLVNRSTFEETAFLLIFGDLPNKIQLTEFSDKLRYSRNIPESLLLDLYNRPKTAFPMDILQSSVSHLSNYDDDLHSDGKTDNIQRA